MADEAAVTIVMRMRDEASAKLKTVGTTMQNTTAQAFQFQLMMTTVGSALGAVAGLLNQLDSPMAKSAAKFFAIGSAALLMGSAIWQLRAPLVALIGWFRGLAIAKAFVLALSGVGIPMLLAGLAIGGAAAVGITAATGGFGGGGGAGTTNVTIQTAAVMGNEQQARQLAKSLQRFSREDTRVGR